MNCMGYSTSKQFLASLWMKTKKVLEGEVYKVYRMHREMNVCSSSTESYEGGISSGGFVGDNVGSSSSSSSSSSVVDCSGIADSGNHSSNAINDGSSSNICNSNSTSGNNYLDNDRGRGKYSRRRSRKQQYIDLSVLQIRTPTKFIDYANNVKKILNIIFNTNDDDDDDDDDYGDDINNNNNNNSYNNNKQNYKNIYVYLDNMDYILHFNPYQLSSSISNSSYYNNLIHSLLNLNIYSHKSIRIICNINKTLVSSLINRTYLLNNYQPYTQQQIISILVSIYEKRLQNLELNILPKILKKLFYNLNRKLYLNVDHYVESNGYNDDNENMEEKQEKVENEFDDYANVDNNNCDENNNENDKNNHDNNKYDVFLDVDIDTINEDTFTSFANMITKTILTNSRTVFMNIINDSYYYLYESSSMINKNHPLLLYDAITSIWIALYGAKPESYLMQMIIKLIQHYHHRYRHRHHQSEYNIQQSRQQPQQYTDNCHVNEHLGDTNFNYDDTDDNNDYTFNPSTTSTTNTTDNHKNHKSNNTSCTLTTTISKDNFINTYTTIIKPTISELKAAIKLILQLPNYSCNEDEINDFSMKKKIILKSSPMHMLTNNNNNYSSSSHDDNSILKKRMNDFDQLDCETCKYE